MSGRQVVVGDGTPPDFCKNVIRCGLSGGGSAKNLILRGIAGTGEMATIRCARDDNCGGRLQIRDGVAGDQTMCHGSKDSYRLSIDFSITE